MAIHTLLFYKFANLDNLAELRKDHLSFCNDLGVSGRVLFASEGINGSISGSKDQIEKYKVWLSNQEKFKGIEFKEEIGIHHPFDSMIVKIKPEIIRMDKKVDVSKTGKHLSPQEFLEVYNDKNVVILDTRNDYEVKAGRFKGAINPNISTFREFPEYVNQLKISKDTPVVMYCTGGIRCEKASAYMIEQGFTNVSQLHGGIINFCQQLPNTVWEGSCFVFDKRLTSTVTNEENPINKCIHCKTPSDLYRNCKNKSCNQLIFMCPQCQKDQHNCCSEYCKKELLK